MDENRPPCQWPFQDPKLEVPTIYKAYVRGYPPKIWPYMVQYLHFIIYYISYTIIYYHILSDTIIYYHILSYTIIYYHILSYTIIYYHILSYTIIYYHILSYTIIYYYILLYTIIYYYILLGSWNSHWLLGLKNSTSSTSAVGAWTWCCVDLCLFWGHVLSAFGASFRGVGCPAKRIRGL